VENRISPPRRLRATKVPADVRSTVTWYRGSGFSVIVLLRIGVPHNLVVTTILKVYRPSPLVKVRNWLQSDVSQT
jgi:hypothetical protein